jgi:hypothetical protein
LIFRKKKIKSNIKRKIDVQLEVVYGPNIADRGFHRLIESKIRQWGNMVVLGGDFNTILCRKNGAQNVDRIGAWRVPIIQNLNIINGWIDEGILIDLYRGLYPEASKGHIIHVSFKGRDEPGGGGGCCFWKDEVGFFSGKSRDYRLGPESSI